MMMVASNIWQWNAVVNVVPVYLVDVGMSANLDPLVKLLEKSANPQSE